MARLDSCSLIDNDWPILQSRAPFVVQKLWWEQSVQQQTKGTARFTKCSKRNCGAASVGRGGGWGVGGGVLQGNPVLPAELTKRIGHPKADVSSVSLSSDSHRRKANAHASALESFYGGQFTL